MEKIEEGKGLWRPRQCAHNEAQNQRPADAQWLSVSWAIFREDPDP